MPLDEATRRLAFELQRDLRRLVERERSRSERGDEVSYDSVSRMATWETRRGDVIGRWYGEIIASYVPNDRILRWAWAGSASLATATHAEAIFREGQVRSVPQLSMSVVGELDDEEACALARLGVIVTNGEGLQIRRAENDVTFIGLFDSPRPREGQSSDPSRYSVPPPPAASQHPSTAPVGRADSAPGSEGARSSPPPRTRTIPPPGSAYRSVPPIREIYEPRTPRGLRVPSASPSESPERRLREPARGIFIPVATAVLAELAKSVSDFQQALFVVTVHPGVSPGPGRLVVTLVALDASGMLRVIDPPDNLVEGAARMVEADRADGNAAWRKLSAQIKPKPDGGATLRVDVL